MRSSTRESDIRGSMAGWSARGRTSLVGRLLGRFISQSKTFAGIIVWVGIGIVLTIVVLAIFAPFLAPFDPKTKVATEETPPGEPFLLGTDGYGQDVLSGTMWGARLPLAYVAVSTDIAAVLR